MKGVGGFADEGAEFWRDRSFWRRTGTSAVGVWASVGLGFLTTVVVARSLGPNSFGAFALATAVVATVAALLDVPLEEPAVHYGGRALVMGAPGSVHRLLVKTLIADLSAGAAVALLLCFLAVPVTGLASGGRLDPVLVQLAALAALFQTADGTTGAALLLARRPHFRAWSMAVGSGLRLVLVGGAALLFGTPRSVLGGVVCAAALGAMVQACFAWHWGWRMWRAGLRLPDIEVSTGKILAFGLRSALGSTISGARNGLVPTVIGRLSGAEAVGFFQVAIFPMQVADVAGAPVRLTLYPEQVLLAAKRDSRALRSSVGAYTKAAMLLGVPGAVIGWFLLPHLIPLIYSTRYESAVGPARILLVAAVLALATGWSKTLPAAIGRPGIRVIVLALDALVVIPLILLLGSQGANGAAVVVVAGLVVQALTWIILMRNRVVLEHDTGSRGHPMTFGTPLNDLKAE